MLKSLSQTRQSPASSPRFHYATSSHSTPSSPPPRRATKPNTDFQAATPKRVQYVHAGTQWSPMMNTKEEPTAVATVGEKVKPSTLALEISTASVVPAAPPPKPKLALKPESPSIKRRQSVVVASTPTTENQPSSTKRVKEEEPPVKVLPAKYEFCEVEDVVILIADMISELIQTNDSLPLRSGVLTRFHSRTPPSISVLAYLQRLAKHATLTPPLLLSMVYYIDRLCSLYPAFTITTLTVHRFLITAATVAAKGLSDSFWNNATYARVGGIKIAELGLLELDFLYRVDWKIVPNPEILVDYYRGLVERSKAYELEDEEESTDEEEEECVKPEPRIKTDETDTKWNEWMSNVSTKKSEEEKSNSASAPSTQDQSPADQAVSAERTKSES